jgi:hypothetical protein
MSITNGTDWGQTCRRSPRLFWRRVHGCAGSVACAPGGTILITVPDGAIDAWEGHVNFWTEDDFASFLEPIGATAVDRVDAGRGLLGLVRPA